MKKLFEIGAVLVLLAMLTLTIGCRSMLDAQGTTEKYAADGITLTEKTYMSVSYQESNLAKKAIATGGAVTALKIITSDPVSGMVFPTVILGFGTFFFFDLPEGVSAYFHDVQKSLLPGSSEIGSETTIYIMGTKDANKFEIANPELLIDIPGLKVFNPMAGQAGVKQMPNMPKMPKPAKDPVLTSPKE